MGWIGSEAESLADVVQAARSDLFHLNAQKIAVSGEILNLNQERDKAQRESIGENVAQRLFRLGASYTVKNTIAIIMAKPARSVGKNTVPSIRALVMVAETGSTVPIKLARTEPMSLTPCI